MRKKKALKILGLPDDAGDKEIKDTWHRLAHQHHPDRGGKLEDFLLYKKAYEVVLAATSFKCPICKDTGYIEEVVGFSVIKRRCKHGRR